MFKFDFQVEDIKKENPFNGKDTTVENEQRAVSCIEWYDPEEIVAAKDIIENIHIFKLNSTQKLVNDIHITHMICGNLLEDIREHGDRDLDIKRAEDQHSDLIPGVYEGGAKIWECTDDILSYLSQNYIKDWWTSSQVLDLGCGSGILGIYAFLNGAKVTFHDYNKHVLEKITIPNVLLNTTSLSETEEDEESFDINKLEGNVKFFCGDWGKWCKMIKVVENYDIILTCETIYNPDNHQKLLNCLYDNLKPSGTVLLAAKSYYFGVGGGLKQFENLVRKDHRFKYNTVWQSKEGVNREIVELIKYN